MGPDRGGREARVGQAEVSDLDHSDSHIELMGCQRPRHSSGQLYVSFPI